MKKRKRTEVLKMKQLKEILRLSYELGLNPRQVAVSCKVARSTVQDYLRRAKVGGVRLEELDKLGAEELEERLGKKKFRNKHHAELDYQGIEKELCKPGVTKALLWEEYIKQTPEGH